MNFFSVFIALIGCSSPKLEVSPAALSFGEVDFQQERPAEGYNAQTLTLQNLSRSSVQIQVQRLDNTYLSLSAVLESTDPPTLSVIAPNTQAVITLGVQGYALGERDTEVNGSFEITTGDGRDFIVVPWSFTPVRVIQ